MAGASARLREVEEALRVAEQELESTAATLERLTRREIELNSALDDVSTSRNDLERRLAATEEAFRDADTERLAASKRAAAREAELDGQIRTEQEARAALEQALSDADEALRHAQDRHETALASAAASVDHLTERLAQAEAAADADIRRLTAERGETERVLDATEHRLRNLQTEADEAPRLRKLLDEGREKSRRLFQQSGLPMFRCTRDGALVEANRACEALIGRRTIDELRGTQFAPAVFEAPDVLLSLIERSTSATARGSVDATWRRQDGNRLFVRLSATAVNSDLIEIIAEDVTRLRVLEERLNTAHRMEAVGRLASEVATTCGNLLDNIHQNAQGWLMAPGADAVSRHHGERLLDDASRAAGLLRQLATCAEEQARTPRLVDLNTLIRDLEPVLKRVAGGGVDIQLRDGSSPLNVDVGIERTERLFVNLASYGRERMPLGGRLTIELGTVVVDRHFAARHPDVRLGLHALITVTETRRAAGADGPALRDPAAERGSQWNAETRPGVDFGTLQELVSECGGHLWVKVQPPGDMIAKIRLPLLSKTHDETGPNARGAGVRAITRRFRN
jgi:PAS domain S-box-containing protein